MQPIIIKYNGGKLNIEIKQFNQTINLSRSPKVYGQSCIIKSTRWHNDMTQTIKPGDCNYYLMSETDFINIETPQISTTDTHNKLIIQIINAGINIKQKINIEKLKSENINILQSPAKIKNNIYVEF
jgi:hypothetical protein